MRKLWKFNSGRKCQILSRMWYEDPGKNRHIWKIRNLNAGPEKEVWPKRLAITLFFWGIINLIFTSPFGGGILILFAVLIYASRNSMAIYAFGVVWLIIALIQLITGVTYAQYTGSSRVNSDGYMLIIVSIINFFFAGYSIYKNRIVNEGEKQKEALV